MHEVLIEILGFSKSYEHAGQKLNALEDIHLQVERGDILGIIGMSGAGKSTLLRAIIGLVKPTKGHILFQGCDLATMDESCLRSYRQKIGMIFQHFNLLNSRTVAGNIAYPMEIAHIPKDIQSNRIDELLKLVGLEDKKDAYPCQLSGGQKQRVGIARALACHPQVLLCDEATSALDPKTTQEILTLLKTSCQKLGVTIVLITHEMDVIRQICNKVAVLEKGHLIEFGSVNQVFTDPKHPTTQRLIQNTVHEIPSEFFEELSPNRQLLRLRFKGTTVSEPIISNLVRKFDVDANILMGWIDRLQSLALGTLVVELRGPAEGISNALHYLEEKSVHYEILRNEP